VKEFAKAGNVTAMTGDGWTTVPPWRSRPPSASLCCVVLCVFLAYLWCHFYSTFASGQLFLCNLKSGKKNQWEMSKSWRLI
jgi:hypothetical protein